MRIRSVLSLAALASPFAVATIAGIAGCGDRPSRPEIVHPATSRPEAQPPAAKRATDTWLGQWNGPEGTFLRITENSGGAGGGGTYEVTIQNLDGPRTFPGTAVGERIQFERDGVRETLRATNGLETGIKWLAEKSDCLTVRPGEGYCHD